jgi:TonB family protein
MLTHEGAVRLVGANVAQVRLQRGDKPEQHYPPDARREGLDGIVIVDLLINIEGQVQEAEVLSESPPGHGFGIAALDTARTYEFENRLKQPVLMAITIQFTP